MAIDPARLRQLVEGAAAVAGQTDLRAVLDATLETAKSLTGAHYAALGVLGPHGELDDFLFLGLDPDHAASIGSPPMLRGVLGTITALGETVRTDDLGRHPEAAGFPPNHPVMSAFLGVPVRAGDEIFGNLYLADKAGGFTAEDEALVEAIAAIAASAIRSARLQDRARRLLIAEEKERIAQDIHDAVIQDLFAVGLSLQGAALKADDPEVAETVAEAARRIDAAIAELRTFIFGLNHPRPEGLERRIRSLVVGLAGPYDVEVAVSYRGDLEQVPQEIVDDTVQLVREALSNALRHSATQRVTVRVEATADRLVVEVADEGIGFDPTRVVWGQGLRNLRARAARAGGQIDIASTPGEGTLVRAELPYAAHGAMA